MAKLPQAKLAKTREQERRKRLKRIVEEVTDSSYLLASELEGDESHQRMRRDHAVAERRRQRLAAKTLRGEERAAVLTEILTDAMLTWIKDYPNEAWHKRVLRYEYACKRLRADLPPDAKPLFNRNVTWKAIRRYTRALKGYTRTEHEMQQQQESARSGLISRLRSPR